MLHASHGDMTANTVPLGSVDCCLRPGVPHTINKFCTGNAQTVVNDSLPAKIAAVTPCQRAFVIQCKQMEPALIEKRTDIAARSS